MSLTPYHLSHPAAKRKVWYNYIYTGVRLPFHGDPRRQTGLNELLADEILPKTVRDEFSLNGDDNGFGEID